MRRSRLPTVSGQPLKPSKPEHGPECSIENLQIELALLSLHRAEVSQRIRHLRHAVAELIHVFGPEILECRKRTAKPKAQDGPRGAPTVIDLCRNLLSRSPQWVTMFQLAEMIRQEFPSALAGYINSGASVSNALRALRRRGEVQVSMIAEAARWRWIGATECIIPMPQCVSGSTSPQSRIPSAHRIAATGSKCRKQMYLSLSS